MKADLLFGTKWCSRCRSDLPIGLFGANRAQRDGLANWCRECSRTDANVLNYRKQYERRTERKAKRAERMRIWREANPEIDKQRRDAWRAANPGKALKLNRAYRARSWRAAGTASPEQIAARVEMFGGCCSYCGGAYECIDHVTPLSRGGTNWPANLRPSCLSCNSTKRNKTLPEFIAYCARVGRQLRGAA